MIKLQPFDALRKCPKCGHNRISCHYYPAGDKGDFNSPGWFDWEIRDQERIERCCLRCSYTWSEDVLEEGKD